MYQFKILLCCGLFLLSAANTVPLEVVNTQLEEATASSTENSKINWGPVWDDDDLKRHFIQGFSNDEDEDQYDIYKQKLEEHVQQLEQLEVQQQKPQPQPRVGAPATGPTDVCAAPNGLGFRNLLKVAKSLLPLDKILKIIRSALAADKQVQGLKRLVTSPEYRNRTKSLKKSRELVMLKDYSCKMLNLDLKYYADFVINFINVADAQAVAQKPDDDSSLESGEPSFSGHPGIGGLLQDIRDALPQQQLKQLYEGLLASDRYLARGVQRLKSYEYRTLTRNFRRNSDYRQLYQMMVKVGMPMKQLRDLINAALGWNNEDDKFNDLGLL